MATFGTNLQIAARSLFQNRRRALFLGGAIGAVTALLVLLNGLSTGVHETMEHTATTLASGTSTWAASSRSAPASRRRW